MFNLINKLFNKEEKQPIFSKKYEEYLLKKYGKSDKINGYVSLLINDIPNINRQIININGVKILGMEGSFKYKPVDFSPFTQEDSITFLSEKEKVEILITHDKKFDPEKVKDPAHQELIGITDYLFKNKIPVHIHGHIHEPYKKQMLNGTTEYSILGYELIEIGGNNNV